jgi:hypothetical protein
MRLRQLLLRTDVQHYKHVSKRCGGTVFSSVVEPHHFGGAVAATRCGSGSRIKIFYPELHHFDAAPQHLCFLIVLYCTSGLVPEPHLFMAPAALKGCGSGFSTLI